MADDRSAALLVRVWLEPGTAGFRARVTAVHCDAPEKDRTVVVASKPGDVVEAMRHWLDRFVRDGTRAD